MHSKDLKKFVQDTALTVDWFDRPPYTCIVVEVMYHGKVFRGVGFSKCHPNDSFHLPVGREIARGRAIGDAIGQIKVNTA